MIAGIENRIAEWTHVPPSHGEALQVRGLGLLRVFGTPADSKGWGCFTLLGNKLALTRHRRGWSRFVQKSTPKPSQHKSR